MGIVVNIYLSLSMVKKERKEKVWDWLLKIY